jgi:hypothetical protein
MIHQLGKGVSTTSQTGFTCESTLCSKHEVYKTYPLVETYTNSTPPLSDWIQFNLIYRLQDAKSPRVKTGELHQIHPKWIWYITARIPEPNGTNQGHTSSEPRFF